MEWGRISGKIQRMGTKVGEAIKKRCAIFQTWFKAHKKLVLIPAVVSVALTSLGVGGYLLYQYSAETVYTVSAIDSHTIVVNFNHYILWDGENPEWEPFYPIEAYCNGVNPKVGSFEFCLTKQIVLASNVEFLAGVEFSADFGGIRSLTGRSIPVQFPIIPAGENAVYAEIVPFVPQSGVISSGFSFAGIGESSRIEVVTTPSAEFEYSTDSPNSGEANLLNATAKKETLVVGQEYTYQVLAWEEEEVVGETVQAFNEAGIPAEECGDSCGNIVFDPAEATLRTEKRVVAEGSFVVPSPLEIVSQTPAVGGSNVHIDAPIDIVFSKQVDPAGITRVFAPEIMAVLNVELVAGTTLHITPKSTAVEAVEATVPGVWEYGKRYTFNLDQSAVYGIDGSWLVNPVVIDFTAIGAIRVTGTSPGNGATEVGLSSGIKITFDQEVDHTSAEANFRVSPSINGSFSWSGNSMTFKPGGLKMATKYSVKISAGIKSVYGLPLAADYSSSFTTADRVVRTIGKSVDGRNITAYIYGSGSKTVLYTAGLHGSERTPVRLIKKWNTYLDENPNVIPDGTRVIVVEIGNPDGYAGSHRFNENGIDINRNWGTENWTPDIYVGETLYPGAGGSEPYSEPETIVLKRLIENEGVDTVIDLHCCADGAYTGSSSNRSNELAAIIREVAGYTNGAGGWTKYPATGTMVGWAARNRGLVGVLVEVVSGESFSKTKHGLEAALTF